MYAFYFLETLYYTFKCLYALVMNLLNLLNFVSILLSIAMERLRMVFVFKHDKLFEEEIK